MRGDDAGSLRNGHFSPSWLRNLGGFPWNLYAFAVFGFITASLSSYLVGREAEKPDSELAGATAIAALRAEVSALREEIRSLLEREKR